MDRTLTIDHDERVRLFWGAKGRGEGLECLVPEKGLPLLGRTVVTRSRPARREMRSARSASRVFVETRCWWPADGITLPRWPSLIAVVERAERDVVAEFGVPL
jgi:hypothetical protein